MNTALDKLRQLFSKYPDYPVIVAYSGGADSQVLLDLVCQILKEESRATQGTEEEKQQARVRDLLVCHIHHGLSDNADSWQQFAERECERRGVALKVAKVSLALDSGESIEALAREARYQALTAASEKPALILTGHHIDDQLETMLLALKRGSGVKGLGAMASESDLAQHKLCRPLLSVSRIDIETYATNQHLDWITDESNADSRYDRNFLRNEVIPSLTARWPAFSQAAARSAELCQQNQQLVDELAAQDLASFDFETGLAIEKLAKLSEARFNNLIRYFLSAKLTMPRGEAIQMPSQAQLHQLYQQLNVAEDKVPEVKLGNVWARRYKGQLFFTPSFADVSGFTAEIRVTDLASNAQTVELPDGLGKLMFTKLQVPDSLNNATKENEKPTSLVIEIPGSVKKLVIQFSHHNPKILPDYRAHSRSMKKVLQELNIAPWQRKRMPFVFANPEAGELELVTVPDYFICQPFLPKVQGQKAVYLALEWQARA